MSAFIHRVLQPVCAGLCACASSVALMAAKPDLIIVNMTLMPANPHVNQEVLYQAWVKNNSDVPSPGCKCSIRVGGETTPFYIDVPSIPPHVAQVLMRKVTLDKAGRYRVTYVADVDNKVAESNEGNNTSFMNFTVQ